VVQFWAHKEVIFVQYSILLFAYCAVVVVEDFNAVEVCCETILTCLAAHIHPIKIFNQNYWTICKQENSKI
jgi:hypothetical protein